MYPHAVDTFALQPSHNGAGPKPVARSVLRPTQELLVDAVLSLYLDEVKPIDRILRKRLLEKFEAISIHRCRFDVSLPELQRLCRECPVLGVEARGEGGEWAAVLRNTPWRFVDISSPDDAYPDAMWQHLTQYFRSMAPGFTMPGGRLACAQQIAKERLPFFAGLSLGRLCHVVQLAIAKRRLLRYHRGRLVPCEDPHGNAKFVSAPAAKQADTHVRGQRRTAGWAAVVSGIHSLMKTAPNAEGAVPLSNVKRLFRSQLHFELDEAALGCDKLSAVFERLAAEHQCELLCRPSGLMVAPRKRTLPKLLGNAPSHPTALVGNTTHKPAQELRPENDMASAVQADRNALANIVVRNTFVHLDLPEDLEVPSPRLRRATSFP